MNEPVPSGQTLEPTTSSSGTHHQFQFTGSGAEYFRIWIVNVLLSIVTLGIYSAWAKVRRQQYFLRNTTLDSFAFDYHGDPKAILKGRIILIALILAYQVIGSIHLVFGLVAFILMLVVLPWIVVRSVKFRLRNISYRGLRFNFQGQTKEAVKLFMLNYLLMIVTFGLWFPKAQHDLKHFLTDNSRYGHAEFKLSVTVKDFYRTYGFLILTLLAAGLLTLIVSLVLAMIPFIGQILSAFLAFTVYMFAFGLYRARMQNLIWNNVEIDKHRFASKADGMALTKLLVLNAVLTVVTIGLYYPFASIKLWQYQTSTTQLVANGSLDDFVGVQQQETKAFGEEIADWFDLDISA
jgi:uncharacterized membrane protein YjgN (DUF898 family)